MHRKIVHTKKYSNFCFILFKSLYISLEFSKKKQVLAIKFISKSLLDLEIIQNSSVGVVIELCTKT